MLSKNEWVYKDIIFTDLRVSYWWFHPSIFYFYNFF